MPKRFDDLIPQRGTGEWKKSKRILIFEFQNNRKGLSVNLVIGPGDKELRDRIFAIAQKAGRALFNQASYQGLKYTTIYKKVLLDEAALKKLDPDSPDLEPKLKGEFEEFVRGDMQKIIAAISPLGIASSLLQSLKKGQA